MTMEYYRGLLTQPTRIDAFKRHIEAVVKKGDRVLEVGAGLGTYSFFAADAGAQHVTAIEGGPIQSVASTIGRYNRYSNVEFLRGWYPAVGPSEPVDVVIFEDYSPRLLGRDSHRLLHALMKSALKPGGALIPSLARILVAPVSSPRTWARLRRFGPADDKAYGIDWEPMLEYLHNHPQESTLGRDDLAHDPQVLCDVRLCDVPAAKDLQGEGCWEFSENTVLHGLAYWFELEVGQTWLSNAPETDPGSWGHLFLPFNTPLAVTPGDVVRASVGPEETSSGEPGWLKWSAVSGSETRSGHEFKGQPASLADVLPVEEFGHLSLSAEALLEARILRRFENGASVSDVLTDVCDDGDEPDVRRNAETIVRDLLARNVLAKTEQT